MRPAGQFPHAVAPALLVCPFGHVVQMASEDPVPAAYLPATHSVHSEAALPAQRPPGQLVQIVAVSVPALYCPVGQLLHVLAVATTSPFPHVL